MKHFVIQVCLSVFALCCSSVYGLTCLHCEDIPQPRHCHTVTRCEADEVCLAERSATTHRYRLGCVKQNNGLSHGSTRNDTVCTEYCGSDLCNAQACGEPGYPTTRGSVCYNCNYHTDKHPCKTTEICSADEECRIISKDEFGDIILTSGCKPRHDCQDPVKDPSIIVGKRTAREQRSSSHVLCDSCCSGDLCNFNCSKALCASSPCQHGQCISGGNTYKCQCMAGWTGNLCNDTIDHCYSSPCQHGAMCSSDGSTYRCHCHGSWSGLHCEQRIDRCSSSPCQQGYCYSDGPGYGCICNVGWSGLNCDQSSPTKAPNTTHITNPASCVYKGQSYTQGQTWQDGCKYSCSCNDASTGYYRCEGLCQSYYRLPLDCHLVTKQGHCCPEPVCGNSINSANNISIICEGMTHTISCLNRPGTTLQIINAKYGRTSTDVCLHPYYSKSNNATHCISSGSLSVVRKLCQQKVACKLTPSNSDFGEPCDKIYKYLEVRYECVASGSTATSISSRPTTVTAILLTTKAMTILPSVCRYSGHSYHQGETWQDGSDYNCSCDDALTGYYRCRVLCLNWDGLPSICHMEDAPPGFYCKQPTCPPGANITINIPMAYKDRYPLTANRHYNYII